MSAKDEKLRNRSRRRRLLKAGLEILEGPRAIFPPGERDWPDWLECDLKLVKRWTPNVRYWESIGIYVDKTMNKEDYFLVPVVRQVRWHRAPDVERIPVWPTTEIVYGYLNGVIEQVDAIAKTLQRTLANFPLQGTGVCLDRNGPSLSGESVGWRRIQVSNGTQSLEFNGPLAKGSNVNQVFEEGWVKLSALVCPIPREGWLERYDLDLSSPSPPVSWDWNGEDC